ncbi:MAG TPA: arylesterase [Methylocella sp.]|nr:arylesterase [Methylocella sp.]
MTSEITRKYLLLNRMPWPNFDGYGSRRTFLQMGLAAVLLAPGSSCPASSAETETSPKKIIAFGDSLTAGLGLPSDVAFPAVLEKALRTEGYNVTIVNAGVSGETASGGLARLDWTIGDGADGVILELGANDMLRGINPEVTEAALDAVLAKLKVRKIKVMIAGMKATPSLGPEYKSRFDAIYPALAQKYDAPLYPFLLDGVAGVPALKQNDGLHPNSVGVAHIVKGIMPTVRAFLDQLGTKAARQE